jgi:riboflavin kinase/FMN adenylyltransferase
MQVIRGVPHRRLSVPCALTIGNFDGVHRGHQALLARVVETARARHFAAAVMTFEPHPREFFAAASAPTRLSNLRDKLAALAAAGIDRAYVQHFNRRFSQLGPREFVEQTLINGCATGWLLVGDDFRFGARRAGDIALLSEYASNGAFELAQMPTFSEDGERVSSTAVRAALSKGDLRRTRQLLGRAYVISGRVVRGRQLGRTLGFPTLNLRLGARPAAQGVFAVRVHGLCPAPIPGVASVGLRPTVDTSGRWTLEVHLFDFDAEVYGALVAVEFLEKIRDEQKYDTLDALAAAIRDDDALARAILGLAPVGFAPAA